MSKFFRTVFCLLFLSAGWAVASAQLSTASMYGNVTDSTGAAIPKATVTITQTDTGYSRPVTAEANGSYRADFLPVGPYKVVVTAAGFKNFEQTGITLTVTEDAQLNFTLQAGGATETVEVTAEIPLLNTGNSTLGRTVTNVEIDNLPLVDRNVYQLLDLTPGVQNNNAAGSGGNGGVINPLGYPEQHVKINGSSDSGVGQVAYYLDGGSNMTGVRNTGNPLPNPDAIREFRVDTNNFSAQYGRNSAGVVTVLTKSGTNQFHGSVFEFYRTRNFNATEHLFAQKTPYNQHNFGFTVGGPVLHDKLFFFGSYQGFRYISANTFTTNVPTAAMRMGDFSALTPAVGSGTAGTPVSTATAIPTNACNINSVNSTTFWLCNPFTSHATTVPYSYQGVYNRVDPTQLSSIFDPTIMAILNAGLIPLPNPSQPTDTPYTRRDLSPFRQKTDQELYKGDYQMTARQRLTMSYFHETGDYVVNPSGNNINGWVVHDYTFAQHEANIQHTFVISNSTVNSLALNYTRLIGGRVPSPADDLKVYGSTFDEQLPSGIICGVPAQSGCSRPQFGVSSWFTAGNAITGPITGSNVYAIRDVVSSTHGNHTLYYGGEADRENDAQQTTLNSYGVFSFSSNSVSSGNLPANRAPAAIANFFFGSPNTMNNDAPVYANANYYNWGLFFQDDWRIRPNLTLNLGIRYDVQTTPTNTQNMIADFVPGQQSTVAPTLPKGLLLPGDNGIPRGGANTRYGHVSPRVGMAWTPFPSGRTVIHAAAGLFYGSIGGNLWTYPSNGEPFSGRPSFSNVIHVNNPYATDPKDFCGGVPTCTVGQSPFPFIYNPSNPKFLVVPAALIPVDPNFHWPVGYQMNAGFEQQLTNKLAFSASYVASLYRKLPTEWDVNYPVFNLTAAGTSGAACTDNTLPCEYTNTTGNLNNRRPYNSRTYGATANTTAANPFFSSISQIQSSESANYNGLQVTVTQQLTHGFQAKGFYTWSKNLQSLDLDAAGNTGNTASDEPEDNNNHYLDRQRSDYDQRHVVAIAALWKPHYGFTHRVTRLIVNNWTVTSIIQLQSGQPFNTTTGSDTNQDGVSSDRPNLAPGFSRPMLTDNGHSRVAMMQHWASAQQFCVYNATLNGVAACPQNGAGPAGSDGTVRQNSLDAPGRRVISGSIFRDFQITERVRFQLRGEATNVFNLTNLPAPVATLSSSTYGQITGTIAAGTFSNRVLQVGGRILF